MAQGSSRSCITLKARVLRDWYHIWIILSAMERGCSRSTRRGASIVVRTTASDDRGFTLIELLIVVGLITTISAIAVPSLLRARVAGNEGSAIASLRAISSAQSAYAASCGSGFYTPTLVLLGTPPSAGDDPYIGADLNTDPSSKSAYTMTLTAGSAATGAPVSCNGAAAGTVAGTYFVSAAPQDLGARFFGTNQGGMIYQDQVAVPVTQNGAPAGATPIQ